MKRKTGVSTPPIRRASPWPAEQQSIPDSKWFFRALTRDPRDVSSMVSLACIIYPLTAWLKCKWQLEQSIVAFHLFLQFLPRIKSYLKGDTQNFIHSVQDSRLSMTDSMVSPGTCNDLLAITAKNLGLIKHLIPSCLLKSREMMLPIQPISNDASTRCPSKCHFATRRPGLGLFSAILDGKTHTIVKKQWQKPL